MGAYCELQGWPEESDPECLSSCRPLSLSVLRCCCAPWCVSPAYSSGGRWRSRKGIDWGVWLRRWLFSASGEDIGAGGCSGVVRNPHGVALQLMRCETAALGTTGAARRGLRGRASEGGWTSDGTAEARVRRGNGVVRNREAVECGGVGKVASCQMRAVEDDARRTNGCPEARSTPDPGPPAIAKARIQALIPADNRVLGIDARIFRCPRAPCGAVGSISLYLHYSHALDCPLLYADDICHQQTSRLQSG